MNNNEKADKGNIQRVVIIGEDEAKNDYIIKDMKDGKEIVESFKE